MRVCLLLFGLLSLVLFWQLTREWGMLWKRAFYNYRVLLAGPLFFPGPARGLITIQLCIFMIVVYEYIKGIQFVGKHCFSLLSGSQGKESLYETTCFAISAHSACGLRPLSTDVKIGQSHRLFTFEKWNNIVALCLQISNEIYGFRLKKIEVCGNSSRPWAISIVARSSLQSVCEKATKYLRYVQI
jgi:hypothetical protein